MDRKKKVLCSYKIDNLVILQIVNVLNNKLVIVNK